VEERITADWRSGSSVLTKAIATNNKSKEVDDVYTYQNNKTGTQIDEW
jgi:hypothetical protein